MLCALSAAVSPLWSAMVSTVFHVDPKPMRPGFYLWGPELGIPMGPGDEDFAIFRPEWIC